MRSRLLPLVVLISSFAATPSACLPTQAQEPASRFDRVPAVVPLAALPFDLRAVRITAGPFLHAQELDRAYLLQIDPDRLLHTFRINAGLPTHAKPLGGWEEPKGELRGHFAGHYLSGCALMYASTGDPRLKARGDQVVAGLAECQQALGSGYLSAYPEDFITRVEHQQPVWAPYYTLHKILAGLLDMYTCADNPQALAVARRFADWVIDRNSRLTDEQMQRMLGNEHGGMNESLANLYALTGERKYLDIAQRFNHLAVMQPAGRREDRLTGLHANTQIPKFIGAARLYELTGQPWYETAASFFWDTVVNERSYVIGGHSDGEAFSPKETLSQAFGPSTTETCNTYNVLKLTRHLFCWNPRAAYADYFERALYNHILASQNPETGMMCYYVPLRPGTHKEYNTPLDSFWCCTGTGVENHAKYGDSIYFHDRTNGLFVNLFIPSTLDWTERGVRLHQETTYPDSAETRLRFTCREPVELAVRLRHPAWATNGFTVRINGRLQSVTSQPGDWATLTRRWQSGDVIELALPFGLHVEGFRDRPQRFAFLNGPLVLAARLDSPPIIPALVANDTRYTAALTPVPGNSSTFLGRPEVFRVAGAKAAPPIRLEPFFRVHGPRPYTVYWDAYSPADWQRHEAEAVAAAARQRELEARTLDFVTPGFDQQERDHQFQGEHSAAGEFSGRHWRHADHGGWFAYQFTVTPSAPAELLVSYWGSDVGPRIFDVLVDGHRIATQQLDNNQPGRFFDQVYPLPADLTSGKDRITVRFQAHPNNTAGGVFGVRILKPATR